MTMYDLTGMESQRHGRVAAAAQINLILSQPDAVQTVSTIIHEATHQIAYNCGLHTRFSDFPLWISEGIAMYFETPDLRSEKGWRGIGNVNRPRLAHFREHGPSRGSKWLEAMLCDDKQFIDTKHALDAYANAWALTYFLITKHPKEYVAYLSTLSAKKPILEDGPEGRLDDFRNCFGDLSQVSAEFLRYMSRLR